MTNTDQILPAIAKQHLGIPTLERRNSDRLDFHDVAVWGVKAALQAAFDAGAASASIKATTPKLLAVMEFIVADIDEGVKDLGCWHRLLSAAIAEAKATADELLGLLQDISLAMHEGGMRKPKGWLERIDRTIAKARAA